MPWSRLGAVDTLNGGRHAVRIAGMWVVRSLGLVYAWSGRTERLAWSIELPDHRVGGTELLVACGGTVVVVEDHGPREPSIVLGLDPADGSTRWRRKVAFRPSEEGLAVHGSSVLLLGVVRKVGWRVACLDGATGRPLWEHPCSSASAVASCGESLFLAGRDGVSIVSGDGPPRSLPGYRNASSLATAAGGDAPDDRRSADASGVVFRFEDESAAWAPGLALVDGGGKERARLPLPPAWRPALKPQVGPGNRVAVAPGPGLGVRLFDLDAATEVWAAECEAGWDAVHAVATAAGLATMLCLSGEPYRLVVLDPADGSRKEAPVCSTPNLGPAVWADGMLVVLGASRLECFAWEDRR